MGGITAYDYKHVFETDKTNSNTRRHALHRHSMLQAQCSQDTKVRCASQIFATWLA